MYSSDYFIVLAYKYCFLAIFKKVSQYYAKPQKSKIPNGGHGILIPGQQWLIKWWFLLWEFNPRTTKLFTVSNKLIQGRGKLLLWQQSFRNMATPHPHHILGKDIYRCVRGNHDPVSHSRVCVKVNLCFNLRSLLEKIEALRGGGVNRTSPLLLSTQFIRLTWNLVHNNKLHL